MALELPKTLTADEVEALMAMPNLDCPTGLRDRCMLELMHKAGLRVSEVCGLHLRDVRWRERELHIRPEVGKGGREAVLPLDDRVVVLLERWKPTRRRYADGSSEANVWRSMSSAAVGAGLRRRREPERPLTLRKCSLARPQFRTHVR